MTDRFQPLSLNQLTSLILRSYESSKTIFGITEELFVQPNGHPYLKSNIFNQSLNSPIGVAAGPHTQLAQNIIMAWLCGARYIELKTIQTLDELDIAKPCIDMQDEGYNCEWSQELKIKESFNEYLNAWILIHILNHKLFKSNKTETIFNMSVGYNLEGILKDNVQWFFAKMKECPKELNDKINEIRPLYPEIDQLNISASLSNNITLSTMHGCPANEIEEIAQYLLSEKKLHTYVKLNPTLLGPQRLRDILNKNSAFKTVVPDEAFAHDLKYDDAINIINNLSKTAEKEQLHFGLKLSNTLESKNIRTIFPDGVDMMYMSGRALHPITVNLAAQLQSHFQGTLNLSFSGGADAFNSTDLLRCGFKSITLCSDLLKPGGYGRLQQYYEEIEKYVQHQDIKTRTDFISKNATEEALKEQAIRNLSEYAAKTLLSDNYKRKYRHEFSIKTKRELSTFDCISAPCVDTCATHQDIPEYLHYSAQNDFLKAFEVILRTNPFPASTGMVCDHLCQNKCTRINYDDPLQIREVKRYISEQEAFKNTSKEKNNLKAAIIGGGPAGLSCAYYLALSGFTVNVYEQKEAAGGMVRYAIPGFRLTDEALERDIERIKESGVNIHYNTKIDKDSFSKLKQKNDYIFVGAGAQISTAINLDGAEDGLTNVLDFLFKAKKGEEAGIGKNVLIIGGGNSAMDAARTAYRLVGEDGKVRILYRRSIQEMPADQGEIKAVLEENMEIIEYCAPERVILENNKIKSLICSRMKAGEPDASGRPRPIKIQDSEFELQCDTIIPAIGQESALDFLDGLAFDKSKNSYKTTEKQIFIGGDALRGASTAIHAIADGRKSAEAIIEQANIDFKIALPKKKSTPTYTELMVKRAKRIKGLKINELPTDDRRNFKLVSQTANQKEIVKEASRCLYCNELCNICTTVCPNGANYSYSTPPVHYQLQKAIISENGKIKILEDKIFEVHQSHQILNITNFCNECGNCETFCPTSGAPYKEKPHIYLTKSSFDQAKEGYFLDKTEKGEFLIYKNKAFTARLQKDKDIYTYTTKSANVELYAHNFRVKNIQRIEKLPLEISFEDAAKMSIIMLGCKELIFN